jgi:peptide-methionine (S)-S-oxide reductase
MVLLSFAEERVELSHRRQGPLNAIRPGLAASQAPVAVRRCGILPPPTASLESAMTTDAPAPPLETAVLGGGCFWCLEAVFDELAGVRSVESGYAGGERANPSYEQVCSGRTGHAEVVRVAFDPAVLSFRDLLTVFFTIHDPTTRNRQGNDVGTQYRSVIFCQTPEQRAIAEGLVRELEAARLWSTPIVTEIAAAAPFYAAEDYHQAYFARNGGQPYCQVVVAPKVAKFRRHFAERLKRKPAA